MYDLTYSHPSIVNAPKDALICTPDALKYTTEAFIPGKSLEERHDPDVSPFYADLQSLSPLPPALLVCGTEDILIDESVFFGAKWMMVNSDTVLKVFPGALHGFIDFEGMPFMHEGWNAVTDFLAIYISQCPLAPHHTGQEAY
jgi:acetyl esterase/lipase